MADYFDDWVAASHRELSRGRASATPALPWEVGPLAWVFSAGPPLFPASLPPPAVPPLLPALGSGRPTQSGARPDQRAPKARIVAAAFLRAAKWEHGEAPSHGDARRRAQAILQWCSIVEAVGENCDLWASLSESSAEERHRDLGLRF